VVAVSPDDTGTARARTKTDKLDARTPAVLLWKGEPESVWVPDERARVLRRRLARREQLMHARARVKNEVHATLMRRLQERPPCWDLFGVKGRKWLQTLARDLPVDEAETIQAALRHVAFLDREIAEVEQLIAKQLMGWPQAKRLMTVPGVNMIAAASFLAAVGEINRFRDSKRVSRLSRPGSQGAPIRRAGRPLGIDLKAGVGGGALALVEAAWSVVHQPGPLRAFYLRVRARRGHGKAIIATARKPAILFWCTLTREQDNAHQQPSLTAQKLRRLEVAAGAPTRVGKPSGGWATRERMRHAEKQPVAQAQASYERAVRDWQATGSKKNDAGASVTAERA
jgi:transposase